MLIVLHKSPDLKKAFFQNLVQYAAHYGNNRTTFRQYTSLTRRCWFTLTVTVEQNNSLRRSSFCQKSLGRAPLFPILVAALSWCHFSKMIWTRVNFFLCNNNRITIKRCLFEKLVTHFHRIWTDGYRPQVCGHADIKCLSRYRHWSLPMRLFAHIQGPTQQSKSLTLTGTQTLCHST